MPLGEVACTLHRNVYPRTPSVTHIDPLCVFFMQVVQICVGAEAEHVQLNEVIAPETEFYPQYIKADLKLESISIYDELNVTSSIGSITDSEGSIVWGASVESELAIDWTLLPSTGQLLPGQRWVDGYEERVVAEDKIERIEPVCPMWR